MACIDLGSICRFCLKSEGQLFLLLGLHRDAKLIKDNVRHLTGIELSIADKIDYKICSECCAMFEMFIKFRKMCMEMNQVYKNIKLISHTQASPYVESTSDLKEELECSMESSTPTIESLFGKDDDDSFSPGQNYLSSPLFETDIWTDPLWIGSSWEKNELSCEASHSTTQQFFPTIFQKNSHDGDSHSITAPSATRIVRSKYYCKICEKHFFQRNVHMQHHDRYSKACFQCLDEKLIGVYRPELALNRHTCRICYTEKETCAEFLQHAIAHHSDENRTKDSYKCKQCDKVFVMKSESHRRKVHNCVRKLHCPHCPQAFQYAKSFQKHLRIYHSNEAGTDKPTGGDVTMVVAKP